MDALAALRSGLPVLLPADGVYGLCCAPDEEAVRRLYVLKGRDAGQPTALIAASVGAVLALVPELDAAAILPGPFTCVLPNPAGRLPWIAGDRPGTIGVRVPRLPAEARAIVEELGAIVATSANEPGGPAAASLDEVPARIRAGCAAEVDAGTLPGTVSTVVDLTGPAPVVLRAGAGRLPAR